MPSSTGFAEISAHNAESLSVSDALAPWSGVRVLWDGDEFDASVPETGEASRPVKRGDRIGGAGSDTGRIMEVKIAFGQRAGAPAHLWDAMAQSLLANIQNDAYSPYGASNAIMNPAFEIGDAVALPGGALSMIYAMSGELDGLCAVDASAPPDEATNTAQ